MKNNTRKPLGANSWIEPPTLKTLKQDPFDPEVTVITAEIRYKGTNLIGVGLETFQHVAEDLTELPRHIAEYKRLTKIYDDKYGELDALRQQLANIVSDQNEWQTKGFPKQGRRVLLAYELGNETLETGIEIVTFIDIPDMGFLPVKQCGEVLGFDEHTVYAWTYLHEIPTLGRWADNPAWSDGE